MTDWIWRCLSHQSKKDIGKIEINTAHSNGKKAWWNTQSSEHNATTTGKQQSEFQKIARKTSRISLSENLNLRTILSNKCTSYSDMHYNPLKRLVEIPRQILQASRMLRKYLNLSQPLFWGLYQLQSHDMTTWVTEIHVPKWEGSHRAKWCPWRCPWAHRPGWRHPRRRPRRGWHPSRELCRRSLWRTLAPRSDESIVTVYCKNRGN